MDCECHYNETSAAQDQHTGMGTLGKAMDSVELCLSTESGLTKPQTKPIVNMLMLANQWQPRHEQRQCDNMTKGKAADSGVGLCLSAAGSGDALFRGGSQQEQYEGAECGPGSK